MLNNNNNNSLANSLLDGASSFQHNDDVKTTCTTNIAAINIDYFNTTLNYTILILNITMVVCLINVVDWYATTNRMIEMQHRQQNRQMNEKRLQPTSITSSSVDDIDIRRPSNLAILVCFGFGKCTCVC